jgi:hypothetical protein
VKITEKWIRAYTLNNGNVEVRMRDKDANITHFSLAASPEDMRKPIAEAVWYKLGEADWISADQFELVLDAETAKVAIKLAEFNTVVVTYEQGADFPDNSATHELVANLNKSGKFGTGWMAARNYLLEDAEHPFKIVRDK